MTGLLIGLLILLSAGVIVLVFIDRSRKKTKWIPVEEKAYVHIRWHEVEKLMKKGEPANLRQAVVEGDKLVDHCLKHLGVTGETMGERLRNSRERFTDYDGIWKAHKTRNQIVHEARKELLSFEAKQSIDRFRTALTDLGVL